MVAIYPLMHFNFFMKKKKMYLLEKTSESWENYLKNI